MKKLRIHNVEETSVRLDKNKVEGCEWYRWQKKKNLNIPNRILFFMHI